MAVSNLLRSRSTTARFRQAGATLQLGLCLALSLLGSACAPTLRLALVDSAHRKPSNVAMYFSVDTSDGEPVPGLIAPDFDIFEDGRLVSLDESGQTIVNPEVAATHHTLVLVDMSGSVSGSDQVPVLVEAANAFVANLEGYQKVGVYAFDGSTRLYPMQSFSQSAKASRRGLDKLLRFEPRDPSTNLNGALVEAVGELKRALKRQREPLQFGTIVVFTDGTDHAARVSLDEAVGTLEQSDFDVFAIGVGNEIDEESLSALGISGYLLVQDSQALGEAFAVISGRVLAYTRRYYLLSYCSPARAGVHEVTIRANYDDGEDQLNGQLSYQFDATRFGPRCNPDRPPPFDTARAGRRKGRRTRPKRMRLALPGDLDVKASAESAGSIGASGSVEGISETDPEAGER